MCDEMISSIARICPYCHAEIEEDDVSDSFRAYAPIGDPIKEAKSSGCGLAWLVIIGVVVGIGFLLRR